jgi:spore coat polysaccharide biosynthesis protein SpsF (cytidylyltransferase family)
LHSVAASAGVIVFGDGPLIDPRIVDHITRAYLAAADAYDFVGNDLITTYPPGMEVEAFSVKALDDANQRCKDPTVREHGTLYLRANPDRYRLLNIKAPLELTRPDLELEVDAVEDLCVIEAVLDHFGVANGFSLSDIIAFLDANPAVVSVNRDVHRRWKAYRSDA